MTARSGFTLIHLSIAVAVAGVAASVSLPGREAGTAAGSARSMQKLQRIEERMHRFMTANGRRPCPADGSSPPGSATFGVEATGAGCQGGTPFAPLGPDATGFIVAGTMPTRTLGLPDEDGVDAWGRRFTYVVDSRATRRSSCLTLNAQPGGITLRDGAGRTVDRVMAAYVDHGAMGHGAFPGGGSTVQGRVNSGASDADMLINASANTDFSVNFSGTLVRKNRTASFDSVVYTADYHKNSCCGGASCRQEGFRITGGVTQGCTGRSFATGDLNGDGMTDLAVASPSCHGALAPSVYVRFGHKRGTPAPSPLPLPGGLAAGGFTVTGMALGPASITLAAGDVNADTRDDLVISVAGAVGGQARTYVLFGQAGGVSWPSNFNVSTLDGTNGAVLRFPYLAGNTGSLALGDVNGDGTQDLLIGAGETVQINPYNLLPGAGTLYVVFGRTGAWPGSYALPFSYLSINGMNGFVVTGSAIGQGLGAAVTSGDFNQDGVADIAFYGAPTAGSTSKWPVIFGQKKGSPWVLPWSHPFSLATLDGGPGFTVLGVGSDQPGGVSAAAADLNGDGIDDLAIGAPGYALRSGRTEVIFGQKKGAGWPSKWPVSIDMSAFPDGCCTQAIGALAAEAAGASLAAGDFSRDGVKDLLIGAPGFNGGYALFGHTGAWPRSVPLSSLDGSAGIMLRANMTGLAAGASAAAGDINADGVSDMVLGDADGLLSGGVAFVLYGGNGPWRSPYDLSGL